MQDRRYHRKSIYKIPSLYRRRAVWRRRNRKSLYRNIPLAINRAYNVAILNAVDFRGFGAVGGNTAAAAAATTKAWDNWINNSNDALFIPRTKETEGFYFDSMTPPRRSIFGVGESDSNDYGSYLHAASGFTPRSDTFFDCANLGWNNDVFDATGRQVYEGFQLHAHSQCKYTMGVDLEDISGNFNGIHRFERIQARGSTDYALIGASSISSSSPLVGARFVQCSFVGSGGSGQISLATAVDDVSFEQPRLEMEGGDMDKTPIVINSCVNVQFRNPFWRNITDFKSGSGPHIFQVTGGASVITWEGGFVEWAHLTYAQLRHFFYVESGALDVGNIRFDGDPSNPPVFTNGSICRVLHKTGVAQVRVTNCRQNNVTGMDAVFEIEAGDTGGSSTSKLWADTNSFTNYYIDGAASATTNGKVVTRIAGNHGGFDYNHSLIHDGTNLIATDQNQVAAEVTFASGTATVATAGAAVKIVATTTAEGDNLGFTIGTDNTLTTLKPGLRRYHIQAVFLVDVAAGTDNITLHIYSSGVSKFQTAAQSVTSGSAKLFEINILLDLDINKTIEVYAENEDTTQNITVAAAVERVNTTIAHGYLLIS